jgi:hypothetical protein
MTTLAPLAHAATAPAFNGLFYATAATIIPVFFLALAVQGRMYADLLQTARALARARRHPVFTRTADGRLPRSSRLEMGTVNGLAWFAALLIPISGFFGEQGAIIALYRGSDNSSTRIIVLVSTLFLLVAVAMGPVVTFIRLPYREQRKPEPGKTDPA